MKKTKIAAPFFLLILLPFLAAGISLSNASEEASYLLVLNKSSNTLAFVDPQTYKVLKRIKVGDSPHEIAVAPDGRRAYVANYGTRRSPGNTISVIDVVKRKEIRKVKLGQYTRPHGVAVTPDGQYLWVTCEGSKAVLKIDLNTLEIAIAVNTEKYISHMVALVNSKEKVYVASIGSGTVTVIGYDGRLLSQIKTGKGTEGIAVSPDDKFVWVTNRSSDSVSIINTSTDKIVKRLRSSKYPIRVKFTPDGKYALVSNARSNDISVFDTKKRKEVKKIKTGKTPIGILILPDGKKAFVASTKANKVLVIDLVLWKVIDSFQPGVEPDGLAYAAIAEQ